jgi:hypothetical protein
VDAVLLVRGRAPFCSSRSSLKPFSLAVGAVLLVVDAVPLVVTRFHSYSEAVLLVVV